ncbi:MAG: nucleotidyltransferase domain-containing protein, partial [Desulfococcaceae bacterium]
MFAYLFGSYAKGLAHRFSDLDIAVFVPPQDTRSTYRLEMGLGLKFDALLDYRVSADVRTLHTLSIAVVGEIVTFGRLIFSRDEAARVDFEV